jgi:pantothenate kinase type III
MISPGLALSGRALTDHTHALTAEQRKNFPMLANNTEDAINSGCYHQLIGSIHHALKKVDEQFDSDMEYVITGGDAELVMTALDINMSHEPDLVLNGLYLSFRNKK